MSLHPFERFLGVAQEADPFALLGLAPDRADPLAIDEALRRRLGEVFRHPDGRSEDAEVVRAALRESADAIKRELRQQRVADASAAVATPAWMQQAVRSRSRARSAAPTAFNLTAFDRMVLAALVACGGWNARSRAQVVALAQNHGVTVQGLLRVMHGLSEYARSGGPRIGVSDIASKGVSPLMGPMGVAAPPPVGVALLDRLADNLGRELKRGGAWPTIKLAIIFGIVTVVVGIIAVRAIFNRDAKSAPDVAPAVIAADAPSVRPTPAGNGATGASGNLVRLAQYPKPPTFLGNGLPAEAVNAVDRLPALPGEIDELARRVTVADGEPSEAVYRLWEAAVHTIAVSWAIGDASTRNTIDKAMFEILRAAADTPSVSDKLLKTLIPSVSVAVPLDLWRGTWTAGTLARLASSGNLPPVVVDRARNHLEIALSQNVRGSMTFEAAGDLWLAQRVPQLVQMLPVNQQAYDTWELWLSAQRALGEGERHDVAVTLALNAVLETDYDLSTPGPAINVAARLLDVALQSSSALARQRLLDLFDNTQIAARDLWVLTSLLTAADEAPWFSDRLVLPDDADMAHRWRVRDDLAKAWPIPESATSQPDDGSGKPEIDLLEGERWASLAAGTLATSAGTDQTTLMQQIADASRMIEAAAALAAQIPEEARRVMRLVENSWSAAPAAINPAAARPGAGGGGAGAGARPGQSLGVDGAWAAEYNELGKNTEARADSLRALRNSAGTDLGLVDATLIVREAYRGNPQDVRSVAQAVIQQQFDRGPNVAMQLLDQFPDVPATESISELIQSVTGRILPGVRTSAWLAEARLSLVLHAMSLKDQMGAPVDGVLESLIESYLNRATLVRSEPGGSGGAGGGVTTTSSSPEEAAALLLRVLTAQAEFAAPANPTPADLPSLQRRHNTRASLADGPIQSFVAQQLAIVDVTAYAIVAEQPALRERALEIMREHAGARAGMTGVLEQALDVERAVLDLWRLRLGFDQRMQEQQGDGT